MEAHVLDLGESEASIFRGAGKVLCATLVMDRQLFTSQKTILRVGDELEPKSSCSRVVASAFGEQGQLAAGSRAEFSWEAEIERLRASDVGAIGIATAPEEMGKTEEIAAVDSFAVGVLRGEKRIYFAKKRG
jgi:hypothetical protein